MSLEALIKQVVVAALHEVIPVLIGPSTIGGNIPTPQTLVGGGQPQGGATTLQSDPFGNTAQQPQTPQVTPEMIQQLIMPLVQNEATKAMLVQEMSAMGIAQLGDAGLDQLPELYARFQRIAGNGSQQPQGGGSPSII